MARPYRFCPLSRRSLYLFTRHTALLATALSFFALSTYAATAPVGATPGSFAVSPSGAATYTIPIALPPGTNGMAPSLSLNYNSQGGNGLLGMGWSIGGLSVIHRCGSTIALDGIKGGVNYDASDKFCLDGERLINIGGNEYRTQHESWQKIIAWVPPGSPAPSSFTVWSKDGTIREYGANDNSRILAVGQSNVRLWALNKIEDRNGNYLTIRYNNNPTDYTPASITYTGNAAAGPILIPYNTVNFEYGPRTDFVSWYEGGAIVQTTQRLTRITTNAGASLMRAYNLGYDEKGAVGRSRLTSVQECETDGVCLPASMFVQSSAGATGFNSTATWSGLTYLGSNTSRQKLLDVNGDGLPDWVHIDAGVGGGIVHLNNGQGFNSTATWSGLTYLGSDPSRQELIDVNGDGLPDWVHINGAGGGIVHLNNGQGGFNPSATWSGLTYLGSNTSRQKVVDVNGDGLPDWVHIDAGVGGGIVHLNNGQGGFNATASWSGLTYLGSDPSRQELIDVNGDGLPDWVHINGAGGGIVHLNNGQGGFDSNAAWGGLNYLGPDPTRQKLIDVNGDGLPDWVHIDAGVGGGIVHLNNGKGFNSTATWSGLAYLGNDPSRQKFVDVNGDGLPDWIHVDAGVGGGIVHLNNGQGGFNATASWSGLTYLGSDPSRQEFVDINGDGLPDWVHVDAGVGGGIVHLNSGSMPDLLDAVTTGLGVQTNVTYKPLTDNSAYTKGTGATYPYVHIQYSMYVVLQSTQSDGVGGTNNTRYLYTGLKKHITANTSLGFSTLKVTDPAGLVHITNYNQTLDGTEGTVALSETWSGSVRVKQVRNTWIPVGRTLAQLRESVETTRELNNSFIATVTTTYSGYDAYGNPGNTLVNFNDGYTKTTNNTYNNDTNNWLLGQLTQSQVTAEAPGQTAQTRTSRFTYDSLGRLTSEVIEPNSPTLQLTTTHEYDAAFGNRIKTTLSGPGIVTRATSQTYDTRGQFITSKTNALSHTESYENTPVTGALTKHTDINRLPTTWQYDGFGRKEKETRPDGSTTTHTYGARTGGAGTLVHTYLSGIGVSAPRQSIVYHDILGRPTQTSTQGFGGNWIYQYTTYDNLGRTAKTSHPYFSGETPHQTTYTYDALGRALSATAPGNRVTATAYNGLTVTVTNPKNQTLTTVKNSQGQVIRAVDNPGTSGTSYLYDPFGNLTQVTDVAGNITRMTYDLRGRKLTMHDPDMGNWSYSYNTLGELITQTDAKLQTTAMTYDLLGRMRGRLLPNNEGTATWTYGSVIPEIGKLKSLSNPNASETYSYDSLSRPTQVTTTISGATHTQTTTYDTLSRVDTLSYPGTGPQIKNIYDDYGFLTQVTNANTGTVYWSANTADAHSRLTLETYGNGLSTQHQYDHITNDLQSIKTGINADGSVQNLSYRFDEIGNLINRSDSNQGLTENFIYDNLNRLITVSGPSPKSYQYDTLGNITYKSDVGSYTYNPSNANSIRPHAVIGVSGALNTSFTYDPNGNQLTGNGRTIVYTSFNKPKTTTQNGKTVSYVYDANHRRLTKTTAGKTTTYVNAYYEQTIVGTNVEHQYTIYAGTTSVAQLRSQAIAPPPKITGVWPGSGIAGSAVFVFGDGFIAGTKVSIGATPVTAVQLLGKDFLVFFVPSGNPKGTVSVTNSQGSASSTQAFGTPVTGLSLTGVWPGQGNTGQFIFLFGSGFITGTKVSFNGTAAPMLHILSPELLVVVVPKGATDGPIRVTNTQGTVSSSAFRVASSTGLKLYYLHTDHLGSIDTITDDRGQVMQRLSYDAHGKRRNKNGTDATIPIASQITKGYTRHEHDDEVNLIHMNAREYDPVLGRFITPDTIIPGALNSQSYNRYSYVNNNPLSFTDPTGHGRLSKKIRGAAKVIVGMVLIGMSAASDGACTTCATAGVALMASGTNDLNNKKKGEPGYNPIQISFNTSYSSSDGSSRGRTDFYFSPSPRDASFGQTLYGGGSYGGRSHDRGYGYSGDRSLLIVSSGDSIVPLPDLGSTRPGITVAILGVDIGTAMDVALWVAPGVTVLKGVVFGVTGAARVARGITKPSGRMLDKPGVIAVDSRGNAIPLKQGESLTGSKDGRWIQVRDADGNPTGMRIDGPHSPKTHNDPRALEPHAHRPGVTNEDGTPWLPVN